MKFVTSITRDADGIWIVECPAIPGCVSQGKTRAEALENAREAIAAPPFAHSLSKKPQQCDPCCSKSV